MAQALETETVGRVSEPHALWNEMPQELYRRDDIEGTSWRIVLVNNLADPAFQSSLQKLAEESTYRNIFFEPEFLGTSSKWIARHRVRGLALTQTLGGHEALKLFMPVTIERVGKVGPRFFRVWSNQFAPLGHPLIAADDTERLVEELYRAFHHIKPSQARGLLINSLPLDSEFSRFFLKSGLNQGKLQQFNRYQRAALKPVSGGDYCKVHLSGKRRQRLNTALRRLKKQGKVVYSEFTSVPEVEVAMLDFLYLEDRGWKGRRKTSMISRVDTRQLSMDSVRALATSGKCRFFALQLDGISVACLVMFHSGGYYVPWKIAFDENYARYSVGNLLLVHVNTVVSSEPGFWLLDSVTIPDNTTGNRFWPDRIGLVCAAVGFGETGGQLAHHIASNLTVFSMVKRWIRRILGR